MTDHAVAIRPLRFRAVPDDPRDDDKRLFRETVGNVRPLRVNRVPPPRRRSPPRAHFSRADEAAALHESLLTGIPPHPDPDLSNGDDLVYLAPGAQRRLLLRLRRGQYAIQGHIDLHGLTVAEAKAACEGFLADNGKRNRRCLRIVHGKGLRSANGHGVIKTALAAWLAHRDDVLAYCSAPPHDGGTGALYVLLRRRR